MKYFQVLEIFSLLLFLTESQICRRSRWAPAVTNLGRVENSHWSRSIEILCSDWLSSFMP